MVPVALPSRAFLLNWIVRVMLGWPESTLTGPNGEVSVASTPLPRPASAKRMLVPGCPFVLIVPLICRVPPGGTVWPLVFSSVTTSPPPTRTGKAVLVAPCTPEAAPVKITVALPFGPAEP